MAADAQAQARNFVMQNERLHFSSKAKIPRNDSRGPQAGRRARLVEYPENVNEVLRAADEARRAEIAEQTRQRHLRLTGPAVQPQNDEDVNLEQRENKEPDGQAAASQAEQGQPQGQ